MAENSEKATPTFRARLRFRLLKKLNIDTNEHRMLVAGHEVVLLAMTPECVIRDSEWLVMNARGFASEAEARQFGHNLRAAIDLSSVSTRLGVDSGRDVPTSGLFQIARDQVERETGHIVRNNVHGLDVFEDDPRVAIVSLNATLTVHANGDPFLSLAAELHEKATAISNEARDVVLLLNYALMRTEPVAQIVFAFSAVEMLGQRETWSPSQKALLDELAQLAECSVRGNAQERREVSDALTKSLHRLTLRQGVLRLLDRLNLAHLKKDWDRHYAERSTLVHGLAPRPGADYSDLANRSISLCGHILLKAVAIELPIAEQYLDKFYAIQMHGPINAA
jgi:hypothetical protein